MVQCIGFFFVCFRELKKCKSTISDKDILIQQLKEEVKQIRDRREPAGMYDTSDRVECVSNMGGRGVLNLYVCIYRRCRPIQFSVFTVPVHFQRYSEDARCKYFYVVCCSVCVSLYFYFS